MTIHPVTLNLPGTLYERLKRRAAQAKRKVEEEALDVLATAIPHTEDLPADLNDALAPLALLDDTSLWQAARSHFPQEAAIQAETLNQKQQREGLTESEVETLELLVKQYERAMLVRAQAAVLLKQRGYDISSLVASYEPNLHS